MGYLKIATRDEETYYPWALANSVHFYYSEDGNAWVDFNQNYGVLFAQAVTLPGGMRFGLSQPGEDEAEGHLPGKLQTGEWALDP